LDSDVNAGSPSTPTGWTGVSTRSHHSTQVWQQNRSTTAAPIRKLHSWKCRKTSSVTLRRKRTKGRRRHLTEKTTAMQVPSLLCRRSTTNHLMEWKHHIRVTL
jgi:hypothetical protein